MIGRRADTRLDIALREWGRWVRRDMKAAGIPGPYADGPAWLRATPGDVIPADEWVDEGACEETQAQIVRLTAHDPLAAQVLTRHYRDKVATPGRVLKHARARLWRMG